MIGIADSNPGSAENVSKAQNLHGAANNQCGAVWGGSANQRSQFKKTNCDDVHPFDTVEGVKFPKEQLE